MSARSELKTELAESRIETKLPIDKCGLLHVCLSDVSNSHTGALMLQEGRDALPVHMIKLTETRGSRLIVGRSQMRIGEG